MDTSGLLRLGLERGDVKRVPESVSTFALGQTAASGVFNVPPKFPSANKYHLSTKPNIRGPESSVTSGSRVGPFGKNARKLLGGQVGGP